MLGLVAGLNVTGLRRLEPEETPQSSRMAVQNGLLRFPAKTSLLQECN